MKKDKNIAEMLKDFYRTTFIKANIAFVVGTAGIIAGGTIFFVQVFQKDINIAVTLGGAITEVVSIIFINFEKEIRKHAHEVMQLMRLNQNNEIARGIAKEIDNTECRDDALRHIVDRIMG